MDHPAQLSPLEIVSIREKALKIALENRSTFNGNDIFSSADGVFYYLVKDPTLKKSIKDGNGLE